MSMLNYTVPENNY